MYKSAIPYKGLWLAPASVAHQLHQDGKFKDLDLHVKAVLAKEPRPTPGERAREVSARHPFREECDSGPAPSGADPAFMALLEAGAHLDTELMPL